LRSAKAPTFTSKSRESFSAESSSSAHLCDGCFCAELPTEKWGAKTTAFGVATSLVRIHSEVTLTLNQSEQEVDTTMIFNRY
jgi:hypothetical protein